MPEMLLLVDGEPAVLQSLYRILKREGRSVLTAASGEDALRVLQREPVAVCVGSLDLPAMDGLEFLRQARAAQPGLEVVARVVSAEMALAVAAMRAGAGDVVEAGCEPARLVAAVEAALQRQHAQQAPAAESRLGATAACASPLLGTSHAMQAVLDLIERVGPSAATVLIQGESGTGKEVVALALQQRSRRTGAPFVKVNCAAIPDALMESELFGYERGAFTGAVRSKKGRFELADGGTIFLDEIGDMSPGTQMKVLRVLQEGEFDRVGGTRTQRVDVRVIAATNVDLERAVAERRFREDLYYRLRVIEIHLPPLRERKEDIPLLVEHFVHRYAARNDKRIDGLEPEALAALLDHTWPGNVRELENAIERAVVLARGCRLRITDLAPEIRRLPPQPAVTFTLGTTLDEIERRMIAETLRHTAGDKTRAAALLGITARTIYRKLEQRRRALQSDSDLRQPPTPLAPPTAPTAPSEPAAAGVETASESP